MININSFFCLTLIQTRVAQVHSYSSDPINVIILTFKLVLHEVHTGKTLVSCKCRKTISFPHLLCHQEHEVAHSNYFHKQKCLHH